MHDVLCDINNLTLHDISIIMETTKSKIVINDEEISLYRVINQAEKDVLIEMRRLTLDDHPRMRLPGPNPVSIERKDFERIRKSEYVVSEKTDGTRYIMMCTRIYDLKICVIIDRSFAVYLLPLQYIPRVLFQGSVFDGEITVDKNGRRKFVLFDAVTVSGVSVGHLNLSERLSALMSSLKAYKMSSNDPVVLDIKRWIPLNASNVIERLNAAERQTCCDGYIFMNHTKPVTFGRDFDTFKLKPAGHHTVDFMVLDMEGSIGVFEPKTGRHTEIAKIDMRNQLFLIGTIVECKLEDGSWILVQPRFDKNQANDMLTYTKTLRNIAENVTIQDILKSTS